MTCAHDACPECSAIGRRFCDCVPPCHECARLRTAIETAACILHASFKGTKAEIITACCEARRVLRAVVPHQGKSEGET